MYVRLGRGSDPDVYSAPPADFSFGKAIRLREGADLTIIACGTVVRPSLDAAERLSAEGVSVRVVDMHTLKPLDADEVRAAARETAAVLTVEEHNVIGGLGSAVAEVLVDEPRVPFLRHGVPDAFAPVGPPAALYAHYRLDAEGIAAVARELLD
jgi:transketolase